MPLAHRTEITVGQGGGGKLTQDLIDRVFRPAVAHPALDAQYDSAVLTAGGARLAFTTDSHVVSPLFFPGGDIGQLAVNGSVNDRCICGAPHSGSASASFSKKASPQKRSNASSPPCAPPKPTRSSA